MFLKSFLLLFVLCEIIDGFSDGSMRCPFPRIEHGRFRYRQKSKLLKFICLPGYTLAGNKYATCRDGHWDVQFPVCVKAGCKSMSIAHALQIESLGGAWLMVFCMPGYKLMGSHALYCDGKNWNATAPSCVDSSDVSQLSCNFEDPNLCGWTQDELHDFDWKRWNRKTPSSFLFTGPTYDHTYGENGNGYYMYIESTSRLENDTARLISPVYESSLTKNGCFSFYYHMFGKTTGGLRIYQKPEKVPMQNLLLTNDSGRQKYLLFEKWGNQGDVWYTGVAMLEDLDDDFQIIIEGIRGPSFTSDIAIDDIAILQGDNCTTLKNIATTPATVIPDSCAGRCDVFSVKAIPENGCGCTARCIAESDCCPDFFDVCIFDNSTNVTTEEETSSSDELPQTQKLVALSTSTTTSKPTTTSTTPTTTRTTPTTTSTSTTTKPTTKVARTKPPIVALTTKRIVTTKKTPTVVFKTSTTIKRYETTTKKQVKVVNATTKPIKMTTVPTTTLSALERHEEDKLKSKQEQIIEVRRLKTADKMNESSGTTTVALLFVGALFCLGAVLLGVWARGGRGRSALARLRGRVRNDPDVQYLHSSADDDDCQ